MGKINSRAKGQRFERAMCEALGEWWGCKFKRTPLSGGWAKEKLVGDIVPVTEPALPWLFSVECKDQQGWSIDALIRNGNKSQLASFLFQCVSDAEAKKLVPLLIAKSRNVKPLCFMPSSMTDGGEGSVRLRGTEYFTVVPLTQLLSVPPEKILGPAKDFIKRTYG